MHGTVASIGNVEHVGRAHVGDTLRFFQTADGAKNLLRLQVDDADAVVAKLRDEQSLPTWVDGEVVDPAAHRPEGDLCLEHERCRLLRPSPCTDNHGGSTEDRCNPLHHALLVDRTIGRLHAEPLHESSTVPGAMNLDARQCT